MLRVMMTIVTSMLLGAAAGYYIPRLIQYPRQTKFTFSLPPEVKKAGRPFHAGENYRCAIITDVSTVYNVHFNSRIHASPVAELSAEVGTDKYALKVADDGKSVDLIGSFAVTEFGRTDATTIPIVSQLGNFIVAVEKEKNGANVLTLNLESNTAAFSWAGEILGDVGGGTELLHCE